MAFQIGTAADYLDLMDRFNTFVTTDTDLVAAGQNWTTLLNDSGEEYYWQLPGLSGTEEIYLNAQVYEDSVSSNYGFRLNAATGYISGNDFWDQPSARVETYTPYLPLWNAEIPYWFVANGQRAIIIAKVSSSFQSAYIGKINQYALPTQYPYPVFIGASTNNESYKYSNAEGTSFSSFYIGNPGCSLFKPDGSWGPVYQQSSSGYLATLPWFQWLSGFSTYIAQMAPLDGTYPLIPGMIETQIGLSLYDTASRDAAVFGEFDGVYWIPGAQMSPETIITIDSVDYLIITPPNSELENKFAAIKLS